MKTQIGKIPWDNYCMRKYGENLFQSLRQIIINNAVIEKINRDIQIALRLKARGFFVNLGKPLSDVPLKPRSGKDRRR